MKFLMNLQLLSFWAYVLWHSDEHVAVPQDEQIVDVSFDKNGAPQGHFNFFKSSKNGYPWLNLSFLGLIGSG